MDVYEEEFGSLLYLEPKMTVYERFVERKLKKLRMLYNFLPRDIVMLRFEDLWKKYLLKHPEIRKIHEEESKARRSRGTTRRATTRRATARQRVSGAPGKNTFRGRGSGDGSLFASPVAAVKRHRKRRSPRIEKQFTLKAATTRCYVPLKIKTVKGAPPAPQSHSLPSKAKPLQGNPQRPLSRERSFAQVSDKELGNAVLAGMKPSTVATAQALRNPQAKPLGVNTTCLNDTDAAGRSTVFRKPRGNGERSVSSPRNNQREESRGPSIPKAGCLAGTSLATTNDEPKDVTTAEKTIGMDRLKTPSAGSEYKKEAATVLLSEPMSLCESYTQSYVSTKMSAAVENGDFGEPTDILTMQTWKPSKTKHEREVTTTLLSEPMSLCVSVLNGKGYASMEMSAATGHGDLDESADILTAKTQKQFQHNKLSLPKKSAPLQTNAADEGVTDAKSACKTTEADADKELETCPVPDLQQSGKKGLHKLCRRSRSATSEAATQENYTTRARAEEQPTEAELSGPLSDAVLQQMPHLRFVHHKLENKPAATEHSAGECQTCQQKEALNLAKIVLSAQPLKFKHSKIMQVSMQGGEEDTRDAAESQGQHNERAAKPQTIKLGSAQPKDETVTSQVEGEQSPFGQTTRQRLYGSTSMRVLEMTALLPGPDSESGTGGQPGTLCLVSIKQPSTVSDSDHGKSETNASYRPGQTQLSQFSEDSATSVAGVTDCLLPKDKRSTGSEEPTLSVLVKSLLSVQAEREKRSPNKNNPQSKGPKPDALSGSENSNAPRQWKMKWKDSSKALSASSGSRDSAMRERVKCVPEGTSFHDEWQSPSDMSKDDDKFPFVTRRKSKDKQKQRKRAADEERRDETLQEEQSSGGELFEGQLGSRNLGRGVCEGKEAVQPVGKPQCEENLVRNVPDESKRCEKEPGGVQRGGKEAVGTLHVNMQETESSAREKRSVKRIERKRLKKAASVGRKFDEQIPDEIKHGKEQLDKGRSGDKEPRRTEQAGKILSGPALHQISCDGRKSDGEMLIQAVPDKSEAHIRRQGKNQQGDQNYHGNEHKKEVLLTRAFNEMDVRQGEETLGRKESDKNISGDAGSSGRVRREVKRIAKGRDQSKAEQCSFFASYEESLNEDSLKFSDDAKLIKELSDKIECDGLLNDEGPDKSNTLGKGADGEPSEEDTGFILFSLESDDDELREGGDKTSDFFISSWQKKQKVQLNFTEESSDSEQVFPWIEQKEKPKRLVQFSEPLFQVVSPPNVETEASDTYESGSRAASPSDTPGQNVVNGKALSPDQTSRRLSAPDTYGDEIVQELRRNFEKHQAVLTAECFPEVSESSQDW